MTKVEKLKRCKEILAKYSPGENLSNEDYFFMIQIFEDHPDWKQKLGGGIDEIRVEMTMYKNKCFYLIRPDGTSTDISFIKSINAPTHNAELKKACRHAILPDILKFRDENVVFGVSICPITGDILTKENTHIDHYDLTFAEVYDRWIEYQNKPYLISKINPVTDNEIDTYFTDPGIVRSFRIFHNQNTHLRAVTKYANLVILRKTAC